MDKETRGGSAYAAIGLQIDGQCGQEPLTPLRVVRQKGTQGGIDEILQPLRGLGLEQTHSGPQIREEANAAVRAGVTPGRLRLPRLRECPRDLVGLFVALSESDGDREVGKRLRQVGE